MANTERAALATSRKPDVQGMRRRIASVLHGVIWLIVGVETLFVEDKNARAK
jgi:hypothetical protein